MSCTIDFLERLLIALEVENNHLSSVLESHKNIVINLRKTLSEEQKHAVNALSKLVDFKMQAQPPDEDGISVRYFPTDICPIFKGAMSPRAVRIKRLFNVAYDTKQALREHIKNSKTIII